MVLWLALYYTQVLGFEKRQDSLRDGSRWLTVAPLGQKEVEIALQQPGWEVHGGDRRRFLATRIGHGGPWVLATSDCYQAYRELGKKGVHFLQAPQQTPHGLEATFEVLYGNLFSILQPVKE